MNRTFSVLEYGVNVPKGHAMTPVPMDNANVGLTFWVKELNPFDGIGPRAISGIRGNGIQVVI